MPLRDGCADIFGPPVVAPEADKRPPVIAARPQYVEFVTAAWSLFRFPDLASFRIRGQAVPVAMPHRVDARFVARASDEWIV